MWGKRNPPTLPVKEGGGKGGSGGKEGEMTQTLYAYMNIIKKEEKNQTLL
jgi:hypothetical protein